MTKAFAGAAFCALITLAPFTAFGADMTQDQKDVRAVVETMTTAFQDGQIDQVMTAYEPLATILFEPLTPMSDREAQIAAFHQMAGLSPVFTYAGHEVVVTGDIALHIAPWTMTGQMPDGTDIAQEGLSVAVLRRQPDGSWKMVIDNPHGSHLIPAK